MITENRGREVESQSVSFKIVLVHPQIPQNTGNISRLSAAFNAELHLIEPLGFKLSSRYLKRAGLDYWPEVRLHLHNSWESFLTTTEAPVNKLFFITTKVTQPYYSARFQQGDFIIFGSETAGLPLELHQCYESRRYTIPMDNPKIRSLNLSTSVGIVLAEARRQLNGCQKLLIGNSLGNRNKIIRPA